MSRHFVVTIIFLVLLIGSLTVDGMVEVPMAWYIVLVALYLIISAVGSIVLSLQYFVPVRSHGSKGISITFDDGPIPGKTDKILELLSAHDIKAAFFCIGEKVVASPLLAQRIHDEGHLLGNHSFFHHATFDLQSASMITRELRQTDAAIASVVGKRPKMFRPPYGVTNPMVGLAVSRGNYTVIGWSVRSFDTVIKDPEKLFSRVTKNLKDGDVILFHDQSDSMLSILPRLIDHVKKAGLKIVRVDELLKERAYV